MNSPLTSERLFIPRPKLLSYKQGSRSFTYTNVAVNKTIVGCEDALPSFEQLQPLYLHPISEAVPIHPPDQCHGNPKDWCYGDHEQIHWSKAHWRTYTTRLRAFLSCSFRTILAITLRTIIQQSSRNIDHAEHQEDRQVRREAGVGRTRTQSIRALGARLRVDGPQ